MLKLGDKVQWVTRSQVAGSGVLISEVGRDGHCLVAVDGYPGEEHRVIWCAETWLTKVD